MKSENLVKALTIFNLIFYSCNFNKEYKNRAQDRENAESVIRTFYNNNKNINYNENKIYFASTFLNNITFEEWVNGMKSLDSLGGNILGVKLINSETYVVEGTNPSGEYVYDFEVLRVNFKTKEKIELINENDSIKIHYYDIKRIN